MNTTTDMNLRNAVASVEIEGYSVSNDEKILCLSFLNGEISKKQFINAMLERSKK